MDDWEEENYDDTDEIVNEDLDDDYPDEFRTLREDEEASEASEAEGSEDELGEEPNDETEADEDEADEEKTVTEYSDEDLVSIAPTEDEKTDYTESQSVAVRIVKPDNRKTSEFLQRTELAAVLAVRARQITSGSQVFVDIGDEQDAINIAKKELFSNRNPLVIRRYVGKDPDGTLVFENWAVRERGIFPVSEIRDPIHSN